MKEKLSEMKDEPAVKDFHEAVEACQDQAKRIKRIKKNLFDTFRDKYYHEYVHEHSNFKSKKRRLYRVMANLNRVVDIDDRDWGVFTRQTYEMCERDTKVPLELTF